MNKQKQFTLNTTTDMKVVLLFLIDNIAGPVDHTTLIEIVRKNTNEISFDYDECLRQLVESEHICVDEFDGERYYGISDKGRMVASELYDNLDPEFLQRSLRLAVGYINLTDRGARINAFITETETKKFKVTLEAFDRFGEVMSISVTVNSRTEAEVIKTQYESKPDGVYRGVLFAVTGRLGFMS